MTDSPEMTDRRRRWPWILLLLVTLAIPIAIKLRLDTLEDRERLRVWKAEAESLGIKGMPVAFGLPYFGRLRALDFITRDKVAISVRSDDVARTLMQIQAPQPA